MFRVPVAIGACTAALVASAGVVSAQTMQGPTSGVGSGRAWLANGSGVIGQSLSGQVTAGGGWFSRRVEPGAPSSLPDPDSQLANVAGAISYSLSAGRLGLYANYQGLGNYAPVVSDDLLVSHGLSAGASVTLGRGTTVNATSSLNYEPPFARTLQDIFQPGDGIFVPPPVDPGLVTERALTRSTRVDVQHLITQRTTLAGGYAHWRFDAGLDSTGVDRPAQVTDEGFVRLTQQIASGLAVRAGYVKGISRSDDELTDEFRTERETIDAGVDFSRALSLSRRTTLAFGTGTSYASEGGEGRFFFTGNVQLNHEIGRSWRSSVFFNRSADFVQGITGIVLSDRAGVDVRGGLSRRASVTGLVEWTRGDVGIESENSFDALRGSAGLSYAATRNVSLGLNYVYYRSDFANGQQLLAPGVQNYEAHSTSASIGWNLVTFAVSSSWYRYQSGQDRTLTASVSLFAPLVNVTRSSNASR